MSSRRPRVTRHRFFCTLAGSPHLVSNTKRKWASYRRGGVRPAAAAGIKPLIGGNLSKNSEKTPNAT